MEKTLAAILEEGAVKIGAKQSTVPLPDTTNSNLFCVKRTLETRDYGNFEAFASSSKKKSAQHLAAGKILLQILDKPCWSHFPFRLPSAEEAKIAVENEIDSLKNEGMTVSENPVGTLQNICKQRGFSDPMYEYKDLGDNPKLFEAKCIIHNFKEITAVGSSKKVAKANVAKDMLLAMPHDALTIFSQPKISEDGFQPVLSNERMKASAKASKEEVLRLIEQAVNSASEDSCCRAVDDLVRRGLLDQIFKKPILIEKRDHKSLDPSKMLRTLHIVDANVFEKVKKLCKQNVLFSFIGIGENDKSAKNEAARNLLFHVKNYYELRVID